MSIFVSPQDYLTMSNECEQLNIEICEHNYKFWCKKDKIDTAKEIITKITPIINNILVKNSMLSFDKILLMSLLDILSSNNEKIDKKNETDNRQTATSTDQFNTEKQNLINNFIDILSIIKQELDNNN